MLGQNILAAHKNFAFIPAIQIDEDFSDRISAMYSNIEGRLDAVLPANYDYQTEAFKQEVTFLLEQCLALNLTMTPDDERNKAAIKEFARQFLFLQAYSKFDEYKNRNEREYFESVKKQLENCYVLMSAHAEQGKLQVAQHAMREFAEGLQMCAPGIFGHLEELRVRLTSKQNITYWLAALRTQIVKVHADQFYLNRGIHQAYHVHVQMRFAKQANEWGYALLKNNIRDVHAGSVNISQMDFEHFKTDFIKNYTESAVIECVEAGFLELVKNFNQAFPTGADGWIEIGDLNEDIQRHADQVIDGLKLDPSWSGLQKHDLFEFNDDYTKTRFIQDIFQNTKQFVKEKILQPQNILTVDPAFAFNGLVHDVQIQAERQRRDAEAEAARIRQEQVRREWERQARERQAWERDRQERERQRQERLAQERARQERERQARENQARKERERQSREKQEKKRQEAQKRARENDKLKEWTAALQKQTTSTNAYLLWLVVLGALVGVGAAYYFGLSLSMSMLAVVGSAVATACAVSIRNAFIKFRASSFKSKNTATISSDKKSCKAFKDGLKARDSLTHQVKCCFIWNDYRNMSAYYAGMEAKRTVDTKLIKQVTNESWRKVFK